MKVAIVTGLCIERDAISDSVAEQRRVLVEHSPAAVARRGPPDEELASRPKRRRRGVAQRREWGPRDRRRGCDSHDRDVRLAP